MRRKIVTIAGARPQFIKVAPVSRVLREQFTEVLVNTGQHYDYKMAGIFFDELNIPKPDYDLGVGSNTHGHQTGQALAKIEDVLLKEKPDAVLVYGDTNSTLAGALAASKLHIPLFHVEAGLRSFNKKMPEEVNRILTDHVSSLLFPPTDTAVGNLENEGISNGVHQVGDVMYDAVLHNIELAVDRYSLDHFQLKTKGFILVTIHRAENTDDAERMGAIVSALLALDQEVVFPIHPRTIKQLQQFGLHDQLQVAKNIRLIEPISYLEMLLLEKHASAIVTDSGGVQKEAYFAKVPCFTLRTETEWVETVQCGWNTLVDPLQQHLQEVIQKYEPPIYVEGLYGDGQAAQKILGCIQEFLKK